MTTIFIFLCILLLQYIFFTLGRIYERNVYLKELDQVIARIDAEREARFREINKILAKIVGVQE